MNNQQSTFLTTAHNVQAFLDENATVIGPIVASARRNFDDAVAQLTAFAVKQETSRSEGQGATARLRAVRALLRNHHMSAVRQVARIALSDSPDLVSLTVPTRNLSDPRLVAAAYGMAEAAEPHASVFVENGMPVDFIAQLRSAADDVRQLGVNRDQKQADVSSATASLRARESRVRKLLKLLNALIVPRLGTDAGLLTKWRKVRAIEHQRSVVPVPATVGNAGSPEGSPPPATAETAQAPAAAEISVAPASAPPGD
jgi:hypothetical protein